jgi:thioredoxin 1
MVKEIKDTEYETLIKDGKVVIDCFAPWCGPCKMISPIIDAIAEEMKDINFYKINVDEAEKITTEFQIMSIPTILIFENGKLKDKVVGFRSKSELEELFR